MRSMRIRPCFLSGIRLTFAFLEKAIGIRPEKTSPNHYPHNFF